MRLVKKPGICTCLSVLFWLIHVLSIPFVFVRKYVWKNLHYLGRHGVPKPKFEIALIHLSNFLTCIGWVGLEVAESTFDPLLVATHILDALETPVSPKNMQSKASLMFYFGYLGHV